MIALEQLAFLDIIGPDACQLLQDLSGNDVKFVTLEQAQFNVFCNQKGRVIGSGLLALLSDSHYRFITYQDNCEALAAHLTRFRLRSKADITTPKTSLTGIIGVPDYLSSEKSFCLGQRYPAEKIDYWCYDTKTPRFIFWDPKIDTKASENHTNWEWHDIQQKMPLISSALSGELTPHMLNYPALGWISFSKGCYLGQEIVARTEHLGKAKKTLAHFHHDAPFIKPNTHCMDEEKVAGTILISCQHHSLAAIAISSLAKPLQVEENGKQLLLHPQD